MPQPDGPISETNSPASICRSIPVSAVTFPFGNVFVRPLIVDDAHATCSGARRTTSFSATTTARKNVMPSPAAITFVAHRFAGCSE